MWYGGEAITKIIELAVYPARRLAQMRQCKILRETNSASCPCSARWMCPFGHGSKFIPQGDEEIR